MTQKEKEETEREHKIAEVTSRLDALCNSYGRKIVRIGARRFGITVTPEERKAYDVIKAKRAELKTLKEKLGL